AKELRLQLVFLRPLGLRLSERGSGRAPNTQTASPRALADSLMQLAYRN
ncbi:hypothetical protein R4H01_31630, partial [Pseudomonas aeruginosa]